MPIHSIWRCLNMLYIQYGCGMQSVVVYSLNHDSTTILPQFSKIRPHLHMHNSVRVHPYAHPQHIKVLNHFIHIQYRCGCSQWWFTASTMTPQCHMWFTLPQFPKIWPSPAQVYQCKGASICPSIAYEGSQTLFINPIWMRDAVSGGLQPQPWHRTSFWLHLTPSFQNFALTCTGI